MASIFITGVGQSLTSSFDTFWDAKTIANNYGYGYLGSYPPATPDVNYTLDSGSGANTASKPLQMYTPFPTSTVRGKLYFLTSTNFASDYSALNSAGLNPNLFTEIQIPSSGQYYVITPSLESAVGPTQQYVVQYAFVDEDDLYNNAWRIQAHGSTTDPITTEATWISLTVGGGWTLAPYNLNLATTGDKAKIVASILGYTPKSITLQAAINPKVKGAMVVAGAGTPFDNISYNNIVPLVYKF
jgi:hypothetical protein